MGTKAKRRAQAPAGAGIITVGCTGFPVPATRYFKELAFVEMPAAPVGAPGTSTLRRFRREAPTGFEFAAVAPKEIGQEGFRSGKVLDAALAVLVDVVTILEARTVIFTAPADFAHGRVNRAAAKELLERAKAHFPRVVWEAPVWSVVDVASLAADVGVVPCRDPLAHGLADAKVAYYRLPGPAGHKSRYEDPAIEALAELARAAQHDEAVYVFSNVDMFSDAKRLRKALNQA
jgi:uncharacterized protein YecE (DUF72 family)